MKRLQNILIPKALRKIMTKMPEKFGEKLTKGISKAMNMPFTRAVDKFGWNGILEEMGEERVGDLLKFALNLDKKEGYSFEQFLDAAFGGHTMKDVLTNAGQEALAFGVTGVGLNAGAMGLNKLVNADYTKDNFLIDSGILRAADTESILDSMVREEMIKDGHGEEDIENVIHDADRDQKVEYLKQRKVEVSEKAILESEIQDDYYKQAISTGADEAEAYYNSRLVSAFFTGISSDINRARSVYNKTKLLKNVSEEELQNQLLKGGISKDVYYQSVDNAGAEKGEEEAAKKEWQKKGIGSKYFKRWFGNSKIIDKNGKPLVLYHGTLEKFDTFKKEMIGTRYSFDKKGFFFISSKNIASDYAASDYDSSRKGDVMPVYLSVQNPLIIDSEFLIKEKMGNLFKQEDSISFWDNYQDFILEEADKIKADGIIIDDGDNKMVVAFEPEQIKSVNNQGTFDSSNPNIYYQEKYADLNEYFNNPEIAKAEIKLEKDIKAHLNGTMHPRAKINFGKAPLILQDFGVPDKNMMMPQHKYDCSTGRKEIKGSIHNISDNVMKKLPSLIADPIMIAYPLSTASKQENRVIVAVKELDNDKNPICVIIDYDWQGNKVNIIPSAYGREDFDDFVKACDNENKIVYIDEKNLLSHISKRSSFRGNSKGSINSITYKEDKFNPKRRTYYQESSPYEAIINEAEQYAAKKVLEENSKSKIKEAELTEEQKKYRDTAYNIIWYALSHSKDEKIKHLFKDKKQIKMFLGNTKQTSKNKGNTIMREKLEFALREIGDVFSSNDGFLPEWAEFFDNPNIGETGSDSKLAMDAYNAIIERRYLNDFENDAVYISNEDVKRAKYELSYLIKEYKNSENKEDVMIAFLNWSERQDWIMQTDLITEWERRTSNTENKNVDEKAYTAKGYGEYLNLAREKKEDKIHKYRGFFEHTAEKNYISIMNNSNRSTMLHELGHLFLNGLNELAEVDEDARIKLDAVNKWLKAPNNGEYTRAQHEKFARSFEAYLYTGKAPTNRLKEVFQWFRNVLKEIYATVSSIYGADISKEAQDVFNLIFQDEHEAENKKTLDIYRKVKNIGVTKENITNKNIDKKLDETQSNHREACYDILSLKTGKSKKWLKYVLENKNDKKDVYSKIQEIEELIDEDNNKIAEQGAYNEDWVEFFEADLFGDDVAISRQAYQDIVSKAYKKFFNEYDYQNEKSAQYAYLLKRFEKEKGEDRTPVLGAFYMWLDKLKQEDKDLYYEKFMNDTSEIERFENLGRLEQVKEEILRAAKEVQNKTLDKSNEFAETVKVVFHGLDFLQAADKAKLLVNVLECPNLLMLEARIDSILDIAKTMEDINEKRELVRKITKELKETKDIKKGSSKYGKYDYRTNKLFEALRKIDKLPREVAEERLMDEKRLLDFEKEGISFENRMTNRFLTFKAHGLQYTDTETVRALYNDILKIKEAAKEAKNELELEEALNNGKEIQELVDILKEKKQAKGLIKFYNEALCNWESSLNTMFNGNIKDKYSFLYSGAMTSTWIHNEKKKFEEEAAKIYGRNSMTWYYDILKNLQEKKVYQVSRKTFDAEGEAIKVEFTPLELNKMKILLAWIWSHNETLNNRLVNMFGENQLEAMFDELSEQDLSLGRLMLKTASSYHNQVNKVFIRKYGIELPKASCYFPSTPERQAEVDMFTDYNFIKSRAASDKVIMEFYNPLEILYSHIDGVGKFVNMAEEIDHVNKIFKDKMVESHIKYIYGDGGLKTIRQALANITYRKEAEVYSGYSKLVNNLVSNWIQGNVAVRGIVAGKQLLSCTNYAVDMPVTTWIKGFSEAILQPKKTIDYMMKIPYVKARFESGAQNEFLKEVINNSMFSTTAKLKEWMSLNIRLGDIGAIIFGGKPYLDYLIKERGMDEKEAIKRFMESTMRSQQSSDISSLSNLQVAWGRNPVGKLWSAYRNALSQYVRMATDAIISCSRGEITQAQCAKILFNFVVLQPFLYTIAGSGSILALFLSGGDDDAWKQVGKDLASSVLTGNAKAFPLLGDLYAWACERLILQNKYTPQTMPLLGDLQNEIVKLSKEDIELKDVAETLTYVAQIATGYPVHPFVNVADGIEDIVQGDVLKGALRTYGMSEHRAQTVLHEKNKKKGRKKVNDKRGRIQSKGI